MNSAARRNRPYDRAYDTAKHALRRRWSGRTCTQCAAPLLPTNRSGYCGTHYRAQLTNQRTPPDGTPEAALITATVTALGYPTEYAAARVRDFLAALSASGAPGAVYPLGPGRDVYVERVR